MTKSEQPSFQVNPDDRVHEARLANGLQVLVLPVEKAPVVTVQVWYRVGSRNENPGRTGLSHILEHMMFKGTEKLGPEEFAQIIQANGGQSNAFTSKDYTTYFETIGSDRLEIALELEADRMANLKLTDKEFQPERDVVMEERRMRSVDDPWGALYEELSASAFRAHPYQWPIIGWMSDLEKVELEDLERHYRTYYHPGNAVLVIAGNVDPVEAFEAANRHFGKIPAGPEPPDMRAVEPPQLGERRIVVRKEANLPAIVWAWNVPNGPSEDGYALEVLSTLLAGGESSSFYRRLVVEKRLFLDVGTNHPFLSLDPDLFTVMGQVIPGKPIDEAESGFQEEIDLLHERLFDEDELAKAKKQLVSHFVFAQDSNFYQAMLLGRFEFLGDWRWLDDYLGGIEAVTAEDVRRVVRKYLLPERRTIAVLEPIPPRGEG